MDTPKTRFPPAPAHRIFIFFPTVFHCLGRASPAPRPEPCRGLAGDRPSAPRLPQQRVNTCKFSAGYSGAHWPRLFGGGRTGSSAPAPRSGARLVVLARPGRSERTRGALNDLLLGQNVSFPASQAADVCGRRSI